MPYLLKPITKINQKQSMRFLSWLGICLVLLSPQITYALPPPDFLFAFGSQFVQIFSFFFLVLGTVVSGIARWSGYLYFKVRKHRWKVALMALVLIILSAVGAWMADRILYNQAKSQFEQDVQRSFEERLERLDVVPVTDVPTPDKQTYLQLHPQLPLTLSNESFTQADFSSIFVLDAREDEEFAIGRFPGSTHVRFADLLAGAWTELPTDQEILVLCWSGIRGEEVTSFLRSKGLAARFLEEGADGWVRFGGVWEGEIAFSSVYAQERYSRTFTTSEVYALIDNGVVLVDAREDEVFARDGIANSIHITSIFTSTIALEELLDQVPAGSQVITVCDDFVSCFDAKIVGIKLEQRGHTFLGRFTSPYDY